MPDNEEDDEHCPELVATEYHGDNAPETKTQQEKSEEPTIQTESYQKVPITIVTGYLGSGKTTLLKYILSADHGLRVAVLLNEFGDSMDIERQAIEATVRASSLNQQTTQSPNQPIFEDWIELRNGCLCCSVKDAGVKAIENLMKRKGNFDHVILETTGLANPGPIASMFWLDAELESNLYLDGIVAVVDCRNAVEIVERGEPVEFFNQLLAADRVILNKTDQVSGIVVDNLETKIQAMNSMAEITRSTYCKVEIQFVLNLHAYEASPSAQLDKILGHQSSSAIGKDDLHSSLSKMSTACLVFEKILSQEEVRQFETWLEILLWEKHIPVLTNLVKEEERESVNVIRTKACLLTEDGVLIYQAVCDLYDRQLIPHNNRLKQNRLVLIGHGLDEQAIRLSFPFKISG